MLIALISDIHGNLVSLDSVLADIGRRDVDRIICLGDVTAVGPQPREVVERLRTLGCPCVMGNHETLLLDIVAGRPLSPNLSPILREWEVWGAEQLSDDDIDYIRSFHAHVEVALDDTHAILCVHGSPRSNRDFILAETPTSELNNMLDGNAPTVLACGHTHVQMVRRHENSMVVNVGSVGCPFERIPFSDAPYFLPWCEYATVNFEDGNLDIQLHRVSVDIERVKQAAFMNSMPSADIWAGDWRTTR